MKSSIGQYSRKGFARNSPSILCNDDKICEKKLSELFQYKRIPQYYCVIQYFSVKEPDEILGKSSSFSASYQLLLVLLNSHLVFCQNRKQTLEVLWGQDRLKQLALLCFERAYVNRVDFEKVIDEFSSK